MSAPSCQISPLWLLKCALTDPKIANFGIILPKRGIPSTDFYKIWHGGGSSRFAPSRHILPFWLSKCGLTAQKSPKMVIFGINVPQRGIPLSDIYKILPGEGTPGPHLVQNFTVVALRQKNITLFCLQPARDPGYPSYLAR